MLQRQLSEHHKTSTAGTQHHSQQNPSYIPEARLQIPRSQRSTSPLQSADQLLRPSMPKKAHKNASTHRQTSKRPDGMVPLCALPGFCSFVAP